MIEKQQSRVHVSELVPEPLGETLISDAGCGHEKPLEEDPALGVSRIRPQSRLVAATADPKPMVLVTRSPPLGWGWPHLGRADAGVARWVRGSLCPDAEVSRRPVICPQVPPFP
jgi:hypothetical protein